jgi:hypothetical protein
LTQGEVYELIQLRKDLYKLIASNPNLAEISLTKVKDILTDGGRAEDYQEIEKLVEEGDTVMQAIEKSQVFSQEIKTLKEQRTAGFYQISQSQYYYIILNQIKKLGKLSFGNLQKNMRKNLNVKKEPSLIELYYPQFDKVEEKEGRNHF